MYTYEKKEELKYLISKWDATSKCWTGLVKFNTHSYPDALNAAYNLYYRDTDIQNRKYRILESNGKHQTVKLVIEPSMKHKEAHEAIDAQTK